MSNCFISCNFSSNHFKSVQTNTLILSAFIHFIHAFIGASTQHRPCIFPHSHWLFLQLPTQDGGYPWQLECSGEQPFQCWKQAQTYSGIISRMRSTLYHWCGVICKSPFANHRAKWRKCAFWGAKIILNDSNSLGPFHMPRQQMLASQGLSNWIPNQQMLRYSLVLLAPGPYSIFWPMPTCSSLDLAAATWHWRGQPQRWMLWLGNVGGRKKGHHDVWVYKLNLLQHDVYSFMEMSKIPQIKPVWCSRHPAEEIDLDYPLVI